MSRVRDILASRPPPVTENEVTLLAAEMAAVQRGAAVVLQGGDCAETFQESSAPMVGRKLKQMYGLAGLVREHTGLPVVTLGRIAGQYAKPRSSAMEVLPTGDWVPIYRGDAVNDVAADQRHRTPDPSRLIQAYDTAQTTLDLIRRSWADRPLAHRLYASHELLLMDYELPLIRQGISGPYIGSTHLGWIGDRTRQPEYAHVSTLAAVGRPTAVKIGPTTPPDEAVTLSRLLNPHGIPGHLTFIVRMGAEHLTRRLPPVISAVTRGGSSVIWLCDPMHGNTTRTAEGRKTRRLPAIRSEITAFVRVVREHKQWPGGLHLELTPQDVTECLYAPSAAEGAAPDLTRYRSVCDPRLNPDQAVEVVTHFAALI